MTLRTATLAACVVLASTTPAFPQLAVSDAVTESNTAAIEASLGITNATLAQIQISDAQTAASVTTPGDPGLYQGVNGYLDQLDGTLTQSGISAQTMNVLFPGWVPLQPDAMPQDAQITAVALTTFAGALAAAQAQASDFDGENTQLASIEAGTTSANSLFGLAQMIVEAQLATAEQIQMERQLLISLITVITTRDAEELNESAQAEATDAQAFNGGILPQ